MKKYILLLFLSVSSICAFSQREDRLIRKLYVQLAGGSTNHDGSSREVGLQAILKKNWMVTASRHDMEIEPKNVPADYQPGFLLPFVIVESPLMQM
jgi:hypothetical protein